MVFLTVAKLRLSESKENMFSFAEREHLRCFGGKGKNNNLYRKRFI